MFQLEQKTKTSLTIQNPGRPLNVLLIESDEEAAEVHQLLTDYLATRKQVEYIGSEQAQAIAAAEGYQIPMNTLTNAYRRGTIPHAHKRRGRWYMPRSSFELWFQEWRAKQPLPTSDPG